MLPVVEQTRLKVSGRTDAKKKSQLGQFLTPVATAAFMAGLFPESSGECRLLDAGAGVGSLSSAFLERCASGYLNFKKIKLTAFEIDESIHTELHQTLLPFVHKLNFSFEIIGNDFIEEAVNAIQFQKYWAIQRALTNRSTRTCKSAASLCFCTPVSSNVMRQT